MELSLPHSISQGKLSPVFTFLVEMVCWAKRHEQQRVQRSKIVLFMQVWFCHKKFTWPEIFILDFMPHYTAITGFIHCRQLQITISAQQGYKPGAGNNY
jgi:hypothetical protein